MDPSVFRHINGILHVPYANDNNMHLIMIAFLQKQRSLVFGIAPSCCSMTICTVVTLSSHEVGRTSKFLFLPFARPFDRAFERHTCHSTTTWTRAQECPIYADITPTVKKILQFIHSPLFSECYRTVVGTNRQYGGKLLHLSESMAYVLGVVSICKRTL